MAIHNIGRASFNNDLADLFETVQDQRLQLIEQVRDITLSSRGLFELEAARLAQKLGPENPRAQAMRARVDNRLELLDALGVEAQIAKVRAPLVDDASALIHGRIVAAGLKGVASAEVSLVNDQGEDLGVAKVKTDEAGYYAIELKPDVAERLGSDQKLFLSVAGERGKVVPATAEGFTITAGERTLREVVLTSTDLENVRGKPDLGSIPFRNVATPASSAAPVDVAAAPTSRAASKRNPPARAKRPRGKKGGK